MVREVGLGNLFGFGSLRGVFGQEGGFQEYQLHIGTCTYIRRCWYLIVLKTHRTNGFQSGYFGKSRMIFHAVSRDPLISRQADALNTPSGVWGIVLNSHSTASVVVMRWKKAVAVRTVAIRI